MSEYLSKKAVLEWFGLMHLEYSHNAEVSEFIESGIEIFESGAFDATEVDSEVQRLRAALEKITKIFDDPNLHELTACQEMNRVAKEALSTPTTTEPTNAAKVKRIECPFCGCDINVPEKVGTEEWRHKYFGAEWPEVEGDGNDA